MSWPAAVAVGILLLLYFRSPIDLIPDRIGPIGLLDDFLLILTAMWWLWRRFPRPKVAGPASSDAPSQTVEWDPYAVLGVGRDASAEEITRAYREQMMRYHPDRVADLGEELRELAHRRALDIQRAYEEIGKA